MPNTHNQFETTNLRQSLVRSDLEATAALLALCYAYRSSDLPTSLDQTDANLSVLCSLLREVTFAIRQQLGNILDTPKVWSHPYLFPENHDLTHYWALRLMQVFHLNPLDREKVVYGIQSIVTYINLRISRPGSRLSIQHAIQHMRPIARGLNRATIVSHQTALHRLLSTGIADPML